MSPEGTPADAFNRGGFATRLADEIVARSENVDLFNGPVTVNLNSAYGSGKTTFLKLLEKALHAREYWTIYFDAWQHDLVEDPLTGFISTISRDLDALSTSTNKLQTKVRRLAVAASKIVARVGVQALLKGVTGMTPDQIRAIIDSDGEVPGIADDAIKGFLAKNESAFQAMGAFRRSLDDYVKTIPKPPLLVFVDELDRCRPSYSIRLLETIKHLFNVKGVAFIVATNTAQLAHSVKAIYGEGFEAELYLKRFFTLEVRLPIPDRIPFLREQLTSLRMLDDFRFAQKDSPDVLAWAVESVTLAFDLSLRDLILLMPHLKSIRLQQSGGKLDIYWLFFLLALAWKKPAVFLLWSNLASRGRGCPSGDEVDQALEASKLEPRTDHQLDTAMQRDLEGYETGAVARDYVRTAFAPHDWLSQELQRKEREHGNKYDLHLDLIHSIINEFKQGSNPLLLYFDLVKHLGVSTLDLGRGGSKAR